MTKARVVHKRYLITFRKFKKNCKFYDSCQPYWNCDHENASRNLPQCVEGNCPVLKTCDHETKINQSPIL